MSQRMIYVSEEHLGPTATPKEAQRVVDLLSAQGWRVAYGGKPWQFDSDEERSAFELAFNWALDVVTAEKAGSDENKLFELAQRRMQINDKLKTHRDFLMVERPEWKGYWRWLIETPADVILAWIGASKKDVPKE